MLLKENLKFYNLFSDSEKKNGAFVSYHRLKQPVFHESHDNTKHGIVFILDQT